MNGFWINGISVRRFQDVADVVEDSLREASHAGLVFHEQQRSGVQNGIDHLQARP